MIRTRLFKHVFVLLCILAILNFFAEKFYLYWTTNWFDMIMHFLGGGLVGLTAILYTYYRSNKKIELNIRSLICIGISCAIIVGLAWEVFELSFGVTTFSDGIVYFRDTTSDILFDIVGATVASLYARNILSSNKS